MRGEPEGRVAYDHVVRCRRFDGEIQIIEVVARATDNLPAVEDPDFLNAGVHQHFFRMRLKLLSVSGEALEVREVSGCHHQSHLFNGMRYGRFRLDLLLRGKLWPYP